MEDSKQRHTGNPCGPYYIGVEIGGTKQQVALGTADGHVLQRRQVKLGENTTAHNILQWIEATVRELCAQVPAAGVGVGFGGPLDPVTGRVVCSLQVEGWKGFALKDWFAQTFPLPATVLNDTVTGGLGELFCGAGKESQRFFYTNIGTGIGGGLYWPGGFGASTLGYTWVPDWHSGAQAQATRLEYLCAGPFIEKRLNTPGYVPANSLLAGIGRPLTCKDLGEGAQQADAFCCAELDRVAGTLALGLSDVVTLAFPDTLVIGGGVAKMGEVLFSRLRHFTRQAAFVGSAGSYRILPGTLGDDAVLVGALLLASRPELSSGRLTLARPAPQRP